LLYSFFAEFLMSDCKGIWWGYSKLFC